MQLSLSRHALEVAEDVSKPILVTSLKFGDVTNLLNVGLIACLSILFVEN